MNGWAVATGVAIWTLILGSAGVFAWFIAEILQWRRPGSGVREDDDEPGGAGPDAQ